MQKTILTMLSVITLMALTAGNLKAENNWPGVTKKVLVDNETLSVTEVTFNAGAVADWHSHLNYSAYAITDVKMLVEIQGKPNTTVEVKAGEAMYSPAVTHKTTNVGTKAFTVIVTELKSIPHKH